MMRKIFKNQSSLEIRLKTGIDLSNAAVIKIRYIKPSGITGEFIASIRGDPSLGIVEYSIIDQNEIDESGKWVFWSFITFTDGRSAPGNAECITIYEEGSC